MLQRFNSVLLHDTLPVDLPDLWPSDILILALKNNNNIKNYRNNNNVRCPRWWLPERGRCCWGEGNIPVTLRAVTPVDVAFCNNSRTIESALTTTETESLLTATAASYQLSRAELQCGWNTCPLEYTCSELSDLGPDLQNILRRKGKGSPYSITGADPGSWQSACRWRES